MKYKVATLAGLVCVVVVLFFPFSKFLPDKQRYHQHREAPKATELSLETGEDITTHLPLLTLDTQGAAIPGMQREKAFAQSTLQVFDNGTSENRLTDEPKISTFANIKYRGNTSLHFDKKSYLVKLTDKDGNEKGEEMLGMPKHDNWILNGPFLDKTLIRNYLCMNISGEMMEYAPRVRFCELIVNGEYQGVYLLMEQIAQGEDRVDISKYKDGNPFTSYIIRADRGDVPENELNNFTKYTHWMAENTEQTRYVFNIEYPGTSHLTPELVKYIEKDFSAMEKALYSYDYDSDQYGYETFADVDSFVDYFIINEFFQNYDAGLFSTYYYKDVRGKFHIGPVWDFNNACDNYVEEVHDGTGFVLQNRIWYFMLTKDKGFIDRVVMRYHELRKGLLSEENLMQYIDGTIEYLGPAVERNFSIWGYTFDPEQMNRWSVLKPVGRNLTSYDEAVSQLKGFLKKRGDWMDENIETLYQYSHDSKNKKFNH
ncbi:CotH kinase family protein [Zongyangia hominis]|uniref:CotH kinase family protein n=1 Tax=Zongyangia hominis TaxID=2763677 RepID=A0A926ED45_9FIRM|nr:CotH kinase family protein [Zongyangia hominis]MBC8569562.1 CotH kinase family protein [Zongyangia hominis]